MHASIFGRRVVIAGGRLSSVISTQHVARLLNGLLQKISLPLVLPTREGGSNAVDEEIGEFTGAIIAVDSVVFWFIPGLVVGPCLGTGVGAENKLLPVAPKFADIEALSA